MTESAVAMPPPPSPGPRSCADRGEDERDDYLYYKGRESKTPRRAMAAMIVEEDERDEDLLLLSLPPVVRGLDAAIKWLLVIGGLLVAVGLLVALVAMLRTARGARLGLAWVSVRVVDLEAKETVLVGTFRPSAPRCEDNDGGRASDAEEEEGDDDDAYEKPPKGSRYAQRVDLGMLLVPSGKASNLRLVVTDCAWLSGSAAAYARWVGGATDEPGLAPALPVQSGAPEVSFKTRVASSGKEDAATLAVRFVVRTPVGPS